MSIYTDVTKEGYKMHEIDKIDPVWYFKMIAYGYKKKNKKCYIEDVLF